MNTIETVAVYNITHLLGPSKWGTLFPCRIDALRGPTVAPARLVKGDMGEKSNARVMVGSCLSLSCTYGKITCQAGANTPASSVSAPNTTGVYIYIEGPPTVLINTVVHIV